MIIAVHVLPSAACLYGQTEQMHDPTSHVASQDMHAETDCRLNPVHRNCQTAILGKDTGECAI